MAQGRRPACCCLPEECLLSGGGNGAVELKVTLDVEENPRPPPGSEEGVSPAFCGFSANKELRSVVRWTEQPVSQTQSWQHPWVDVCRFESDTGCSFTCCWSHPEVVSLPSTQLNSRSSRCLWAECPHPRYFSACDC